MEWKYASLVTSLVFPTTTTQVVLQAHPKHNLQDSCFYEQVLFKEESLHDITRGGFTSVWLPPPSKSVQLEGYLPASLYDCNSFYGTQAMLERLVQLLKERGLQVWIDWPLKRRCWKEQVSDEKECIYIYLYIDMESRGIGSDES